MEWTPFAGLTALDADDPISIDGASFLILNPRITDHFLQVGAVTHRHDAHLALPNPTHAPTGSMSPSGGNLPGTDYAVTYTVLDAAGGETMPAPALSLTSSGGGIAAPTVRPIATVDHTQGIMPEGGFFYALTYTDGAGGETTIGPNAFVYVDPGYASAAVQLSGLSTGLTGSMQWRLWRSYEGADWHLVTQGSAGTFLDAGFDPPDNPARPPDASTIVGARSITVTLPNAATEPALASGSGIRVYLGADAAFTSPSLYAELPIASGGRSLLITDESLSPGSPPHVSSSVRGAAQINPDTDILNWTWKRPVANAAALPTTGNTDGDARVTLDTDTIYVWRAAGSAWVASSGGGGGGPLTSSQKSASYTLALGDASTVIEFTGASATPVVVPPHSSVAFPVGTVIEIFQYGAGQVTVTTGSGVTLRSFSGRVSTAGQYATIGLRQRAIDEWVLSGGLA